MTPSFDPRAMTRRCTTDLPIAAGKALDHALPLLLVIAAFLLGCQELASSDIWWHVRSGQWILEHQSAPGLDPFTFTSSDLLWVDMTWLFQVMLAVVFAAGGVRSIVLVTAAMYAAVMIIVSALRDRRWPSWLFAGCWLPALCAHEHPVRAAAGGLLGSGDGRLPQHSAEGRFQSQACLDSTFDSGDLGERAWGLRAGPDHPGRLSGRATRGTAGAGAGRKGRNETSTRKTLVGPRRGCRGAGRRRVPGKPVWAAWSPLPV